MDRLKFLLKQPPINKNISQGNLLNNIVLPEDQIKDINVLIDENPSNADLGNSGKPVEQEKVITSQ